MWNWIVKFKSNNTYPVGRFWLLALGIGVVLFLMWQNVHANAGVAGFPAQLQVDQVVPSLIASEAEHASGAYVPGVGVVFIMDLIRGPNSTKNRMPAYGVRDWAIYLMQTFGPQLSAVPPTETVAFSIEYYDYSNFSYHQFVLTSKAADVADPTKYTIWLDGKPFAQAVPPEPTNTPQVKTPPAGQKTTPSAASTPAAPNKTAGAPTVVGFNVVTATPAVNKSKTPVGAATKTGNPTGAATKAGNPTSAATKAINPTGVGSTIIAPTSGTTASIDITQPTVVTFNLADTATGNEWKPLNGQWAIDATGYSQNMPGFFDLVTFYTRSISGNYNFEADMQFVSGQMGGGLVFNSPSDTSKSGSQMVSYTGSGKYMQWGYFDDNGIFQFQDGSPTLDGSDGKNHHLQVRVRGTQYSVLLDGVSLGKSTPLWHPNGGYVGLLASMSQVVFNNAKLEQLGP